MNKQTVILIFGTTFIFSQATGQNFKEQFNDLFQRNDTIGQLQLLEKWEKTDTNDPELYISFFNYYVHKSTKDVIRIGDNPKGENVLQITDPDSTGKAPVGYMYSDTYYDPNLLEKGLSYIEKGIEINPTRLDMWFGDIYMYGQAGDYDKFTAQILKVIDYSAVIKNKWTWDGNKPLEDPKAFMLSNIQNYVIQLYNTEDDALLDNMKSIPETVLKYYPDHVESLSNISIVYLQRNEYDKALEVLLKAQKIAPKDYIVLSNIAQAYKLKGDNKNAIKYYKLAQKYGNDEVKAYAKEQIEALGKQ